MKRVGHLFEQVAEFHALCRAARRAARGKRVTAPAAAFLMDLESEALRLERELQGGHYQPRGYRTFTIVDPKPRTISAAPFRDRVVHHALCAALEPVFERYAIDDSFACRTGKGSHAAVQRAQHFARRHRRFLKLDVRHFYETADHEVLRRLLRRLVKDRRLLDLSDRFIQLGAPGSPPGRGMPIGNLTSQHFANLYLGPLDHFIQQELRAPAYLRYMDDLLLFADDRRTLRHARDACDRFVRAELRLEIKHEATRLGPIIDGVPFLGFRIWPRQIRLDPARARRFRRKCRARARDLRAGRLDEAGFARALDSLCGWAAQADTLRLRRDLFARMAADAILPGGEEGQRARSG